MTHENYLTTFSEPIADPVPVDQIQSQIHAHYDRKIQYYFMVGGERVFDMSRWRSGKRHWQLENPSAAEIPVWVGSMGYLLGDVEADRAVQREILKSDEHYDPLSHYSSKLNVLAEPLRIHSVLDVNEFEKLQAAIVHFQPGMGYRGPQKDSLHPDGYRFSEEVPNWLQMGIKGDSIAGIFDAIGGLACVDPTIFSQFFSPDDILELWKRMDGKPRLKKKPTTYKEVVSGAWTQYLSDGTADFTEVQSVNALQQLRTFAHDVSESILITGPSGDTDVQNELIKIQLSAEKLGVFLDLIELTGYKHISSERPVRFGDINVIIAVALADGASGDDESSQLADKMASAIRRRRLAVSDIPDLIKSFTVSRVNPNTVDSNNDTFHLEDVYALPVLEDFRLDRSLLRDSLAVASTVLGTNPERQQILKRIQNDLIPELVLNLRKRGVLPTDKDGYINMGLPESLWDTHQLKMEELKGNSRPLPGSVAARDAYIEFSSSAAPLHVGHEEMLRGISRVDKNHLILAGVLPADFDGNIIVGLKLNRRKPNSDDNVPDAEIDIEQRYPLVERALQDVIGHGLILQPIDDPDVSTPARFELRKKEYEGALIIRYMGDDKLKGDGGIQYPKKDQALASYPHVINLRHSSLNNFDQLAEKMRAMYGSFPGGLVIEISQIVDTTSRGIRAGLKAESGVPDYLLTTQICPRIADNVREIWQTQA